MIFQDYYYSSLVFWVLLYTRINTNHGVLSIAYHFYGYIRSEH